jgi:predicted porin
MKKTLLAATLLAGFAGVAHAQSTVTLYGLVDAGFVNEKIEGQKARNALDSGLAGQSRWGIRGSEDLGNGLKAIFTLESGYTVDDGQSTQSRLFGRYAFVGLESASAGRVTLGRTTNLGFLWGAGIANPFGLSYGRAAITSIFAYGQGDFGAGARVNNSAYYYSPSIAGFQGAVGYSFASGSASTVAGTTLGLGEQEVAGNSNNTRLIDAAVKYENGPLKAFVNYTQTNLSDSVKAFNGGANPKQAMAAATWDFGVVAVYGGYSTLRNPLNNVFSYGTGATAPVNNFASLYQKDNQYTIGLSAPIGAGKLMASYSKTSASKVDGYAVGYVYDLSKRTNVYAFFNSFDARQFVTQSNYTDLSRRQLAFGLQHKF